jgi:two-component system, cell cycle sensor histidine kinase and response regulator CckA
LNKAELRQKAEQLLSVSGPTLERVTFEPAALERELTVHEIELEVQNDELRRHRIELEEARARAEVFFTQAPVACLLLDRRTRILEANAAAEALLARPKLELEQMLLCDLIVEPSHAVRFRMQLGRLGENGSALQLVAAVKQGRGGRAPVIVEAMTVGESFACWLTTAPDLTLRDRSEEREQQAELNEARCRFDLLSSTIEDAVFILQPSTMRLVYLSPAFERIFKRSVTEASAPGVDPMAWVHPDDRTHARSCVAAIARGEPLDVECRILQPEGTLRVVRVRTSAGSDQDRVVGIVTDLTQEQALEDEVQQIQRMQSIGALASGIAHDFNNMLMGIIGFGNIATGRLDSAHPARPVIERIIDVAGRGKALTRQLLEFSRKRRPERIPVELDTVVGESAPLIETLVGEHIQVSIRTEAIGCRVRTDPCEIEQVLMNLASNARDAMSRGGRLFIETKESAIRSSDFANLPRGRYATLNVRDTGCGMDQATLARVFEPFFTTKEGGTGLGLANAMGIVKRTGGRMFVSSKIGVGTTFTIVLPVEPATADIELPGLPEGPATILIVEDDPVVRATVAHYIENLGYTPIVAANAAEAKRALQERDTEIEVLLTDVMLPNEIGPDLAAAVRRDFPDVRVIYMSGHDRDELFKMQCIDRETPLLYKPFDQRHLALVLHRLLAPRSMQP